MSEQAAGHIHTGRFEPIRVTLVTAVHFAPIIQFGKWEETALGQGGIEQRRGMALAEDEAVALLPIRTGRVDVQLVEIQNCHDLRRRERPAWMARPAPVDEPQAVHAHLPGQFFQFGYFFRSQRPHKPSLVFCILFFFSTTRSRGAISAHPRTSCPRSSARTHPFRPVGRARNRPARG